MRRVFAYLLLMAMSLCLSSCIESGKSRGPLDHAQASILALGTDFVTTVDVYTMFFLEQDKRKNEALKSKLLKEVNPLVNDAKKSLVQFLLLLSTAHQTGKAPDDLYARYNTTAAKLEQAIEAMNQAMLLVNGHTSWRSWQGDTTPALLAV